MPTCTRCGRDNPGDARFCAACGTALVPVSRREERKVVTVVFADIVGSTARADRLDPEDVRAILAPFHDRLRRELQHFGGTVEKFIGDAVVGVFGAPVAHEDDPERAVRAALAIQEAIAELNDADPGLALEVRVGVNTGEALVALDARPEAGEGMLSGDVMNTCARLQAAAPPGGVLAGEATYRATERAIEYAPAEPLQAKGKAEPVRAWLALAPRARLGVDVGAGGRAPLTGRGRELDVLTSALARARAERAPQLVTLVGVPGIGKSRLVSELMRIVDEDDELIAWRQGRSLPYGEGVAFWALGEMVKAQAGIFESDSSGVAGAKLAETVAALVPDEQEAVWVERHVRPLAGLGGRAEVVEGRVEEAYAAWRRFFEGLAEQGPAVLVFEDLHWADDGLLDFVEGLGDRLAGVPLLVVCTGRPELLDRRPGWAGGIRNAVTLSLAPLSDEDTARLLAALVDRALLPAETQAALLARAGGVPLFAEEFVRMLEGGGSAGGVPETLHGIVQARCDGLGATEKAVLHAASVLGKVFWTDALAAVHGGDGWELDESLRLLERKEFVRRERRSAVAGARQYAFVHSLVRDVAYGQIPRGERSRMHRAAGEWLTALPPDRSEDRAELLAHHLGSALELGQAAGLAVDDLRPLACAAHKEAGDRAIAVSALAAGERFYERALELAPDDAPDVLLALGRARLRRRSGGAEELERAADLLLAAGRHDAAAEALCLLFEVGWRSGRAEPELLQRAHDLVADSGDSLARAFVIANAGRFHGLAGRVEEGLRLDAEALAIAERIGARELYAFALNNRGVARFHGGDVHGVEDIEESLELTLALGAPDAARAYVNLGSTLTELGELRRARETHELGLAHASRIGAGPEERWVSAELVVHAWEEGRWDEAVAGALAYLANADARPLYMDSAVRVALWAIRVERGEPVPAGEAAELLAVCRAIGDPQVVLPAAAILARGEVLRGATGEASAHLDVLLAAAGPQRMPARWVYAAAVAAVDLGRERDLLPLVERLVETRWSRAAARLLAGEPEAAAAILHEMGAVPDEADAVARAAASAERAGRIPEAERLRARAAELFGAIGAVPRLADGRLPQLDATG